MATIDIEIKLLSEDAQVPCRAHAGDTGYDLYLPSDVTIPARSTPIIIPLGFAMAIPEEWEGQIRPRSSSSMKGLHLTFGTLDSNYRGEVKLIAWSDFEHVFKKGDRIAQLVFARVHKANFTVKENLSQTIRQDGGFGSTGQ